MQTFHFPLDRVLAWRQTQAKLERQKIEPLVHEMGELAARAARLEASRLAAQGEIRRGGKVQGEDLAALDLFSRRLSREATTLSAAWRDLERRLAEQRAQYMEARRRCELLERLRSRRLAAWNQEWDREIENQAAENYLSRWTGPSPPV